MPRLTPYQWAEIRARREAGEKLTTLAKEYNITHAAIIHRAKNENWKPPEDISQAVKQRAHEYLHALTNDPKTREQTIDNAAVRVVDIFRRHQQEINAARERLYSGLEHHKAAKTREEKIKAFEDLKAAKIAAETLAIIQRIERISWGLDEFQNNTTEIVVERAYSSVIECEEI